MWVCAIGSGKGTGMEWMIVLAVSVATAAYLVYALLRPEKF
ncbi:MAG TPA: K(+)-transporting ATPase subunit F [Candidatus Acidoferrales bacterium]|nr:K(+)-transporting ATPase subunit F [Candidatus Acidoferrales bacterium]